MEEPTKGRSVFLSKSPSNDDLDNDEVFVDAPDDSTHASSDSNLPEFFFTTTAAEDGSPSSNDRESNASVTTLATTLSSLYPTSSTEVITSSSASLPHPKISPGTENEPFCFPTSVEDALKSEEAFIDYVMSLPSCQDGIGGRYGTRSKGTPSGGPPSRSGTKVGLDHLDNLCKLMEQLSELREANSRLQRRVQYLENVKNLHELHKEMKADLPYGFDGSLLQKSDLRDTKKNVHVVEFGFPSRSGTPDFQNGDQRTSTKDEVFVVRKARTHEDIGQSQRRTRERSKSVGHEEICDTKTRRIFPKWSKVKEALGWERSGQGGDERHGDCAAFGGDSKGQGQSGRNREVLGGTERILYGDHVGTLRIPLYTDDMDKDDVSPSSSLGGEVWGGPASSAEDITEDHFHQRPGRWKRQSLGPSEKRSSLEPPHELIRRQKSTPSPSDRIHQEIPDLKPKSLTLERDIDPEQAFAKFEKEDSKKGHRSPWGRVKTIIERRRDSLRRKHRRNEVGNTSPRRTDKDRVDADPAGGVSVEVPSMAEDGDAEVLKSDNVQFDQRKFHLGPEGPADDSVSVPVTPLQEKPPGTEDTVAFCKKKHPSMSAIEGEDIPDVDCRGPKGRKLKPPALPLSVSDDLPSSVDRDQTRTPSSSPQFHRKSRWTKVKKVLRGKKEDDDNRSQSVPSSPLASNGRTTAFDFEDLDLLEEDDLLMEDGRASSCPYQTLQLCTESHDEYFHPKLTPSASAPVASLMLELQRNLSEDFSRKIQEWEKIRATGPKAPSPKLERKGSVTKVRKAKPEKSVKTKIKDLNWLEKELQKIEKENRRLAKEKQKYEERAHRLQRLRETVLSARNSNKKEVLIRTSAGEFRFEGISDAFTKKLYEWETKRGVRPELSTIALLDSSFRCKSHGQHSAVGSSGGGTDKTSPLQRGLSRSENSVVEVGQPSQTSSNSLPSLKPDIAACDHERALHSRANSEPDLSVFGNQGDVGKQARSHSGDTLPTLSGDRLQSYAPPEVTQLIDSDSEEGFVDKEDGHVSAGLQQAEDNYYNLLEENVLLLEQLKNKEDLCRRMERELEALDERVEEMNKRHVMEMEKYREKLWEVHKPDRKPRDMQSCLKMIGQLKGRIEEVEQCSERLRNDRDKLELSFQYHAEQQANMTAELLQKMRELQEVASWDNPSDSGQVKCRRLSEFHPEDVAKMYDISTRLLKQTRDMEQAMAERSRQVYELRWQLLHRDLSAVRMETELQRTYWQGLSRAGHSRCAAKRESYAHKRSWSSGEGMTYWERTESYEVGSERQLRLPADSCVTLIKTDYEPCQLTNTVHELNKELIKLSSLAEALFRLKKDGEKSRKMSAESEMADSGTAGQITNRSEAPPLEVGSMWACTPKGEERGGTNTQIKVRRNSADNVSIVSGPDVSESSSLNESDRVAFVMKLSQRPLQRTKSNSSTSSEEASLEEESFRSVTGCGSSLQAVASSETSRDENPRELILKYPSIKRKVNETTAASDNQEKVGPDSSRIPLSSYPRTCRSESLQDSKSSPLKERRKQFASERSKGMDLISTVPEDRRQETGGSFKRDHPQRRRRKPGSVNDARKATGVVKEDIARMQSVEKYGTPLQDTVSQPEDQCATLKCEEKINNQTQPHSNIPKNTSEEIASEIPLNSDAPSNQTDHIEEEAASSYTIQLPRKKSQGSPRLRDEHQRTKPAIQQETKDSDIKGSPDSQVSASVTVVLPKLRSIPKQQTSKQKSPSDGDTYRHKKTSHSVSPPSFKVRRGKKLNTSEEMVPFQPDFVRCEKRGPEVMDSSKPGSNTASPKCKRISEECSVQTLKPESPVIRSRSPRKLKRENSREKLVAKEETGGCVKSPSAPQLDWKKTCAKKVSRDGAPNVKNLIEKYNQKVMQHQGLSEPRSPTSAIPVRKGLCGEESLQHPQLYFQQHPDSPGERRLRQVYPETKIPSSPPLSSQSRTRAELQKAKEQFISAVPTYKPLVDSQSHSPESPFPPSEMGEDPKKSPVQQPCRRVLKEDDTLSTSSNRSMDSMSLVMFRTGESCQESRLARKMEMDAGSRQSSRTGVAEAGNRGVSENDKCVSTPTLSKSASAGSNSKLSSRFLNLKLRRSRKKADMATVGQLCRQSLFIGLDTDSSHADTKDITVSPVSPRSCPSSPELKSKGKPKGSWLPKNLFRQK